MKVEGISSQKIALDKAWGYIVKMPFWSEKIKKGEEIPSKESLIAELDAWNIGFEYYTEMSSVKIGTLSEQQYDFFISHAWSDPDDNLVGNIVKELKSQGYKVWYDRDIWGNESGKKNDFLESGIESSRHCVPFLCKEYFQSENSMFELNCMFTKKAVKNIFPLWSSSISKELVKKQPLGNEILETVGIPRGKDDYDAKDLVNRLVLLKNSAEGLKKYNGVEMIAEDSRVMKELEKVFGNVPIPCINKDSNEKFGFVQDDGHVIALAMRKESRYLLDKERFFIERLPDSLAKLRSLQKLDVTLGNITEGVTNLKSLISLDLRAGKFISVPVSIGNLSSLQTLNLSYNKLTTLPESIGNLKSLQTLILRENQLTTLPESIGDLSSLKKLYLDSNKFTTLPESIGNLRSLKTLGMEDNQLSTFPESIGNLKSLRYLTLNENQLFTIPKSIGNLKSLQTLYLEHNQLTTLPESISNLKSLRTLDLGYNKFSTLPESIGNLSSLEKLDLRSNQLSTLPESIGNLSSLNELWLSRNKLTTLPESITNLSKLERLLISGNPLVNKPDKTTENVLKPLKERGVSFSL